MQNRMIRFMLLVVPLLASRPAETRPVRIHVLDGDVEECDRVFFGKVETISRGAVLRA